jgi:hypothetical protein
MPQEFFFDKKKIKACLTYVFVRNLQFSCVNAKILSGNFFWFPFQYLYIELNTTN